MKPRFARGLHCPLTKCGGKASFLQTYGVTDWAICLVCKFTFPVYKEERTR